MAKYGPKAPKRTIPTSREEVLNTIARTDSIRVAPGSVYDVVCTTLVAEGLLQLAEQSLLGRTYWRADIGTRDQGEVR